MNDEIRLPAKRQWIEEHLRCPTCGTSTGLKVSSQEVRCYACDARYQQNGTALNMLTPNMREEMGLIETENVSDHPFDGHAMSIINDTGPYGGMVLDCGSGLKTQVFKHVVQVDVVPYSNVDILGVNQSLPFVDACFDAVFSLDVLEHVDDPFKCAGEIARVLKPGGILYIDLPFLQPEHGYPRHYFNATREGLKRLFTGKLVMEDHVVPQSGHPVWTLHWFLSIYSSHLPNEVRSKFNSLRIGDLLRVGPEELLNYDIAAALPDEARWMLASTTQAILRKPSLESADAGTRAPSVSASAASPRSNRTLDSSMLAKDDDLPRKRRELQTRVRVAISKTRTKLLRFALIKKRG